MTSTVLAYLPSPSQGVWHLGPVPIRAYALCIIAGIVAALIIGDRRWAARGGEPGVIYDIALWAVPFGLVGGRLYHVMTDWRTYFGPEGKGLAAAFQVWEGGLGIWGAVALGAVGAWIACRRRGIPLPAFGDAIAPGIVLAQAVGRLGNYFNQELYGRATSVPWGLEIYDRRNAAGLPDQLNGVSNGTVLAIVHPTFLYELLWNLLIFALLIWVDRRFRIGHGRLFALYVAGYCVGRFCVELMRSDTATHLAGIRINTFTSTFVFIGAAVYIMLAPKGREEPATLAGRPRHQSDESVLDELGKDLVGVAAATGVVAAAKVAGDSDTADGAAGEYSEDMHPDAVAEDEGAEAAAAVELKAIAPQTEDKQPAETDNAAEESAEGEAAVEPVGEEAETATDTVEDEEPVAEAVSEEPTAEPEDTIAEVGEAAEPAESAEPAGEGEEPGVDETEAETSAAAEPADEGEATEPAVEEEKDDESASAEDEAAAEDAATESQDEAAAESTGDSEPAAEAEESEPEGEAVAEQGDAEAEPDSETAAQDEPEAEAVTTEDSAPEAGESDAESSAEPGDTETQDEAPADEQAASTDESAEEAVTDEPEKSEAEGSESDAEPDTETEDEAAEDEATEDAEPDAAEDEPAKAETSTAAAATPGTPAAPAPAPQRRRWWQRRR